MGIIGCSWPRASPTGRTMTQERALQEGKGGQQSATWYSFHLSRLLWRLPPYPAEDPGDRAQRHLIGQWRSQLPWPRGSCFLSYRHSRKRRWVGPWKLRSKDLRNFQSPTSTRAGARTNTGRTPERIAGGRRPACAAGSNQCPRHFQGEVEGMLEDCLRMTSVRIGVVSGCAKKLWAQTLGDALACLLSAAGQARSGRFLRSELTCVSTFWKCVESLHVLYTQRNTLIKKPRVARKLLNLRKISPTGCDMGFYFCRILLLICHGDYSVVARECRWFVFR